MTMTQAAELRIKWKQQANRPACEHLNLELEWSEGGYPTGHYNCIVCGEHAATGQNPAG
jgi:hypothetical protein